MCSQSQWNNLFFDKNARKMNVKVNVKVQKLCKIVTHIRIKCVMKTYMPEVLLPHFYCATLKFTQKSTLLYPMNAPNSSLPLAGLVGKELIWAALWATSRYPNIWILLSQVVLHISSPPAPIFRHSKLTFILYYLNDDWKQQ